MNMNSRLRRSSIKPIIRYYETGKEIDSMLEKTLASKRETLERMNMNLNLNHNYWMEHCDVASKASTCRVKIACVIVRDNILLGIGYNGSASGDDHCADIGCLFVENPIAGSGSTGKSCIRTIHAEMNAVLKCTARGNKKDGWLVSYSSYQPCLNCTKALIQIGVRTFVWKTPYKDEWRDLYMVSLSHKIRLEQALESFQLNED